MSAPNCRGHPSHHGTDRHAGGTGSSVFREHPHRIVAQGPYLQDDGLQRHPRGHRRLHTVCALGIQRHGVLDLPLPFELGVRFIPVPAVGFAFRADLGNVTPAGNPAMAAFFAFDRIPRTNVPFGGPAGGTAAGNGSLATSPDMPAYHAYAVDHAYGERIIPVESLSAEGAGYGIRTFVFQWNPEKGCRSKIINFIRFIQSHRQ